MFKSWRAGGRTKILLSALSLHLVGTAYGATVGQFSGNTSVWANSSNFSNIFTSATMGAAHTVESPEALTATNIANNSHFIVESSATALAAAQVSLIVDYVRGGGTLLLFATPGTGNQSANQILGALGTGLSGNAMSVTNSSFGFPGFLLNSGTLNSQDPAVKGTTAFNNLNGFDLSYYQTNVLSGGAHLANIEANTISDGIRVDRYSLGKVYLFGTRLDENGATNANWNNTVFFMNMLSSGGLPAGLVDTSAPEPATLGLTAFSLAGALLYLRRKRS